VQCWGENESGQLGNNTRNDSWRAGPVMGLSTATSISAGYNYLCARLADATLMCWGDNTSY
jgi:alpha-tubulin suppressor-like RCC1 family protein